jgi:hypothetical protein
MEMAGVVGAKMPISKLIDELRNVESTYDAYSNFIKQ